MIIRKVLDWRIVLKNTYQRVLSVALMAAAVAFVHQGLNMKYVSFSPAPASILGVAISFLIGFRVNSAYDRWWEGRRLWGALVNDSRTFARQIITFLSATHFPGKDDHTDELPALKKELIYRHIAFTYALKNHLRQLDIMGEIRPFLHPNEAATLSTKKHIPNALLHTQGERLRDLREMGLLDDYRQMQMDVKLSSLCDAMGGCERIKNTVFPRPYSFYSTLFVKLYSYLLPFTLVNDIGYLVIPTAMVIAFVFYVLDGVAYAVENPFENHISDTPMSALTRTIEINLREQLGETELPPPVEPINGFLF